VKISKPFLAVVLVGIIACLLITAAILLTRTPIVIKDNDWSGAHALKTSTPTANIFPAAPGWSKTMLPISSPQGTPALPTLPAKTPYTTWTLLPSWIPTEIPTSQP
jgi:hypothetical protein